MKAKVMFSIIIAVRNGAETLRQSIESVAGQTFQSRELIVIDGASTDGTLDVIAACEPAITYWSSEPDRGIYQAWNKALARANGEWHWFLGADDFLVSADVLANVAMLLAEVPRDVHVAYGRVHNIAWDGTYLYSRGEDWAKIGRRYKQQMTIPHQGVLHRRSLFEKHGVFDESFEIAGDYELLLRELKSGTATYLPLDVTAMRQGGLSGDLSKSLTILREVRTAQLRNGLIWPGAYWLSAVLRAWIRILIWSLLPEKTARGLLDFGRRILGAPPHWTKTK
ncbi:MAG TPA: glycosyltransferase family 2 protein [Longimicrobiales bacterium]|nr:glycosyltransferase family 2 protein [Longimicrobiales bacterium]